MARTRAFEPPSAIRRRLLARLPDGRRALGGRGRHAGPSSTCGARAHYERSRGSVRTPILGTRPSPRDRRAAARRCIPSGARTTRPRPSVLEAPERVEEDVARRDEAAIVRNAMDVLLLDQLKVIELAYFGGFTHVEIAEMLESPVGTVKGRMPAGAQEDAEEHDGAVGMAHHDRFEDAAGAFVLERFRIDEREADDRASWRPCPPGGGRRADGGRAGCCRCPRRAQPPPR